MITMTRQLEIPNKEMQSIRKDYMEILELKSEITEMKIHQRGSTEGLRRMNSLQIDQQKLPNLKNREIKDSRKINRASDTCRLTASLLTCI